MRRAAVAGIAVGAAALVAAVGVALFAVTGRPGPQSAAEAYLTALAEGDGETAAALLESPPATPPDLAAALSGATALITDPRVVAVEGGDDAARATIEFGLAGDTASGTLSLVNTDGGWRLRSDALGWVRAAAIPGDAVLIAGQTASADAVIPLLPAAYAVAAAPASILSGEVSATVLPGVEAEVSIDAVLSPGAIEVVQAVVDDYADACAAPSQTVPDQCGIRLPWQADLATLSQVSFRVETHPVVSLSDDLRTFTAADGVLVATATGTTRAGQEESFTYRTDGWTLRGSIGFSGDEMILSVS